MLAFSAILGCVLAGLAGFSAYLIPFVGIGLATISAWEHRRLYRNARAAGGTALADETLVGSIINGLIAAGVAYAGGMGARLLFGG